MGSPKAQSPFGRLVRQSTLPSPAFLVNWFAPEPKEADELALAFRALDRDGDGRVTASELFEVLDSGDDALTRREVDELVTVIDFDGSGCLDFDEFQAALMPPPENTPTVKAPAGLVGVAA